MTSICNQETFSFSSRLAWSLCGAWDGTATSWESYPGLPAALILLLALISASFADAYSPVHPSQCSVFSDSFHAQPKFLKFSSILTVLSTTHIQVLDQYLRLSTYALGLHLKPLFGHF